MPTKLVAGVKLTVPPGVELQVPALAGFAEARNILSNIIAKPLGSVSLVSTSIFTVVVDNRQPFPSVLLSGLATGGAGGGNMMIGKDLKDVLPQLSVTLQVMTQLVSAPTTGAVKLVVVPAAFEKDPPQDEVH